MTTSALADFATLVAIVLVALRAAQFVLLPRSSTATFDIDASLWSHDVSLGSIAMPCAPALLVVGAGWGGWSSIARPVLAAHGSKLRAVLYEIVAVLGSTAALFALLLEDMCSFGIAVCAGFSLYVFPAAPHKGVSISLALCAGTVGALTEYWGCKYTGLWNWVSPVFHEADRATRTLWMIGGAPHGFPIEVVMAYAGAGFWMGSISVIVLQTEHTQVRLSGAQHRAATPAQVPVAGSPSLLHRFVHNAAAQGLHVIPAIALIFAWSEPVYLQSALLTGVGWAVVARLPPPARSASVAWGTVVGVSGLFFEIFATGGLRDSLAVWRYNRTAHAKLVDSGIYGVPVPFASTAPLSALSAYIGTGLLVFGCSFHLSLHMHGHHGFVPHTNGSITKNK